VTSLRTTSHVSSRLAGSRPDLRRFLGDVVPGDGGTAGIRPQQGGQDANGGGLAGAVRAEDAQHRALGGGQADPVQGLGGTEALGEPFGFDDGVCHE